MGEFSDGMATADRLHLMELRVAELERRGVTGTPVPHEPEPAASHVTALSFPGAPGAGPVEGAESAAHEIIGGAERTAELLIDSVGTIGEVAREAADAAVEGASEVAAGAVEGVTAPAEAVEEAVTPSDSGTGERAPSRPPHPLMKKLW
jgi:hypothetical protein